MAARRRRGTPRLYPRFLRGLQGLLINPVLVVHGGAWAIPDDMVDAHLNGVRNAASAGWRVLERGGSSLDVVEEAVVDVIGLPAPSRHSQATMVVAVAARNMAVQRLVAVIAPRAPRFDIVDVPELCLRNLSALLPQDERGVALLAFSDTFAHLLLTRAGVLYLTRRIDVKGGEQPSEIDAAALALELQRSLDYYESFYDQPPITDVVLAPADARTRKLAPTLATETSLQVEVFDAERLFQIADGIEIDTRWSGLIALGAAMRSDGAEA